MQHLGNGVRRTELALAHGPSHERSHITALELRRADQTVERRSSLITAHLVGDHRTDQLSEVSVVLLGAVLGRDDLEDRPEAGQVVNGFKFFSLRLCRRHSRRVSIEDLAENLETTLGRRPSSS